MRSTTKFILSIELYTHIFHFLMLFNLWYCQVYDIYIMMNLTKNLSKKYYSQVQNIWKKKLIQRQKKSNLTFEFKF